jgi:hypothetical protein
LNSLKLILYFALSNPLLTIRRASQLRKIRKQIAIIQNEVKSNLILAGGLGNQLFQLAYAINRNHKNNLQLLFSQNRVSLENAEISGLSNFNIQFEPSNDKYFKTSISKRIILSNLITTNKSYVKSIRKVFTWIFLKAFHSGMRLVKGAGAAGYFVDLDPIISSEIIIGYFQSYRWVNNLVLKEFKSLQITKDKDLLDEYRVLAEIERPLIVHVRLGDYQSNHGIGTLSAEYYQEAIAEIYDERIHGKVWVFSDDLEQARKFFKDRESENYRYIGNLRNNPGLSLMVMSLGEEFVISNSTFSWWAAMWPSVKEKRVHYPEPWFDSIPCPPYLIPPRWIPRVRETTNARS